MVVLTCLMFENLNSRSIVILAKCAANNCNHQSASIEDGISESIVESE